MIASKPEHPHPTESAAFLRADGGCEKPRFLTANSADVVSPKSNLLRTSFDHPNHLEIVDATHAN